MYKLKIKVTKEILERSMLCGLIPDSEINQGYNQNCAIALATKDIFQDVSVTASNLCVFLNDGYWKIPLPRQAKSFIRAFDCFMKKPEWRMQMRELEFEIALPDDLIEEIDISSVKKGHKTLELVAL